MGNFQNILKTLRKAKGLTQDELARKLEISRSTIGMYEKVLANQISKHSH